VSRVRRPEGAITRGTTNPNRLRRVDRWIAATQGPLLRSVERPLVIDLGYGASPITTVELFQRLRAVCPQVEVVGLEIDPARVAAAQDCSCPGLSFRRGGFELPVDRPPVLVRAFNVLRQYSEDEAWQAWDRLLHALTPGGLLVEGTCDEIGRRASWISLSRGVSRTVSGNGAGNATTQQGAVTLAAHLGTLGRPSELAERLPKTLIHRNVPGERIHDLLRDFDRAWATAVPRKAFGPRQRWIAAVQDLATTWPVLTRPPLGGRKRWREGEVTLPWEALTPR